MTQTALLVGDRFADFAKLDGVITVSRLARLLDEPDLDHTLPARVVVGQGVSHDWLAYLRRRRDHRGAFLDFVGEQVATDRTGRRHSHKHHRKNVLLSDPAVVGDGRYQMALAIDDDCELMNDHTTGLHVQGMILTEAARQAFLVVTEWFLAPQDADYYYVINKFATTYTRFAFPVPTDVLVELRDVDRGRGDRIRAQVLVTFHQNGAVVCEAEVDYMAILTQTLSGKERSMATAALDQTLTAASSLPEELLVKTGAPTVRLDPARAS
jgi:A-factor biosynthesis hotdog protein